MNSVGFAMYHGTVRSGPDSPWTLKGFPKSFWGLIIERDEQSRSPSAMETERRKKRIDAAVTDTKTDRAPYHSGDRDSIPKPKGRSFTPMRITGRAVLTTRISSRRGDCAHHYPLQASSARVPLAKLLIQVHPIPNERMQSREAQKAERRVPYRFRLFQA